VTLNDRHQAEVERIVEIVKTDLILRGEIIHAKTVRAIVRDVLDNYKPVGLWSEVPSDSGLYAGAFTRPGVWRRWDIRIGSRLFGYKMFQHENYMRDQGYLVHVKRQIRRRMGESISAWIMGEADPNAVNDLGEGTTQDDA
jgi:hypothetical protein